MAPSNEICIGFDVGKSAHRACAISRKTGEVLFNRPLANREGAIDAVLKDAGINALVVVDQKRNIGALVLERARHAKMDAAYLPGLSMKRARDIFPGIAKTDEIDAEIIARTAIGMPQALRPIGKDDKSSTEIRLLASQARFLTKNITQSKNRLRAVLLEVDPAFEAAVDLGVAWQIKVFAKFGGAIGIAKAGKRRYQAFAIEKNRATQKAACTLWDAACVSSESDRVHTTAENSAVEMLAAKISEDTGRLTEIECAIKILLRDNPTYYALLTVPGIGPKTACALVAGIDISLFKNHDKLASFTGLAPSNKQSGTSINSSTASKSGNKELKNLLIFTCNSLIGTDNEFGQYYKICRERGMKHNMALKAVARKRLKVIFAVMRDARPYIQA